MPNYGLVMLKTWAQAVSTHHKVVGELVGLYHHFLPTRFMAGDKWVELSQFNPQVSTPLFPTHFWQFTSVSFHLSTLSTSPIMNRNYVSIKNNKGALWV